MGCGGVSGAREGQGGEGDVRRRRGGRERGFGRRVSCLAEGMRWVVLWLCGAEKWMGMWL